MEGSSNAPSSDVIQVWNLSLHPLSYVIDFTVTMALSLKRKKKRKTSTVETTHVGPFTSHFSLPKYPSPLLPWTFPSVCIFRSLHLPLSPALCLTDSTTKCRGRWLGFLKGTLVVEPRHPTSFYTSQCLLGASRTSPESMSTLDMHASFHRATDKTTIRSRVLRVQAPPTNSWI